MVVRRMPTLRKKWHFGQIFLVMRATKVHSWTMTLRDTWRLNRECHYFGVFAHCPSIYPLELNMPIYIFLNASGITVDGTIFEVSFTIAWCFSL